MPVTPPHPTFGSVARGEQRPDSDVDLLHTLEGGRALGWEVEDLVESLTKVFHRPVDLVSRRSLHPMIRDRAMAEAETLYAAARVPGRCGHLSGRLGVLHIGERRSRGLISSFPRDSAVLMNRRRYSDALPCAERPALHMGAFQQR